MNIILFEASEIEKPLSLDDRRIKHLQKVIKVKPNELFDAGIIQKSIGKAYFQIIDKQSVVINYQPSKKRATPLVPVNIIIGIIRPVNVQRILRDLCSLGVHQIHLVQCEKSEKSYINSKAYNMDRIQQYLLEGAEQAFSPYLSEVYLHNNLQSTLLSCKASQKFAFDNYEFTESWGNRILKVEKVNLAIGPERGWSTKERKLFLEHNYILCSLGNRVLRTETAALASVSVLLSKMNFI